MSFGLSHTVLIVRIQIGEDVVTRIRFGRKLRNEGGVQASPGIAWTHGMAWARLTHVKAGVICDTVPALSKFCQATESPFACDGRLPNAKVIHRTIPKSRYGSRDRRIR